jgi:hypothetical protein
VAGDVEPGEDARDGEQGDQQGDEDSTHANLVSSG